GPRRSRIAYGEKIRAALARATLSSTTIRGRRPKTIERPASRVGAGQSRAGGSRPRHQPGQIDQSQRRKLSQRRRRPSRAVPQVGRSQIRVQLVELRVGQIGIPPRDETEAAVEIFLGAARIAGSQVVVADLDVTTGYVRRICQRNVAVLVERGGTSGDVLAVPASIVGTSRTGVRNQPPVSIGCGDLVRYGFSVTDVVVERQSSRVRRVRESEH